MNAKEKAIRYLEKIYDGCKDKLIAFTHTDIALDIAIQEAKKEVFDDIEKISFLPKRDGKINLKDVGLIEELRKRHLSTFQKEKEHNYREIQ